MDAIADLAEVLVKTNLSRLRSQPMSRPVFFADRDRIGLPHFSSVTLCSRGNFRIGARLHSSRIAFPASPLAVLISWIFISPRPSGPPLVCVSSTWSSTAIRCLRAMTFFASAGGEHRATVQSFAVTADNTGTITIRFVLGSGDNPQVNRIEIGMGAVGHAVPNR
jgi:hypothetical protein